MKTKLLENIEAKLTGRHKYVPNRISKITYEEVDPSEFDKIALNTVVECRFGVKTRNKFLYRRN